ncbi:MAG: hypothetical protein PV340_01290 [Wolbachia sp.]|nr:hypothetical protein [Wolbachia sp.]MDD9336093.1 hypothetical protein [Wolbachia sp.]
MANITVEFYAKHTDNRRKEVTSYTIFLLNRNMINDGYERNYELWGNKDEETIRLEGGHYERAEIVELEEAQSILEMVISVVQGVIGVCANAQGLTNT